MIHAVTLEKRPKPPGFVGGALRVARVAPFRVLRGRRLLGLALFAFVPVLLVLLMRVEGEPRGLGVRMFVDMTTNLHLTGIFQVVLLFLGAAAIGDDIDDGTILYQRLRPLRRGSIVWGRYLACALSGAVLLAPATVALYVAQLADRGVDALLESAPILLTVLWIVVLASLAYSAVFVLLSLLFRRAVLIGLGLTIGWEVLVSRSVPSNAALGTVSFHLRSILWHSTSEGKELGRAMEPFEEAGLIPTPTASAVGLLVAALVLVTAASVVFGRKELKEQPGDA